MPIMHSAKQLPLNEIRNTLSLILAGGAGTRLRDLTRWHAKPAVPFGGKYRTIDFALSNCINSGLRKIHILTQYKSHSLNLHVQKGWGFLHPELGEFIDLLPAQQRINDVWYSGTADAVFQNIDIIEEQACKYILILAGDHIYKMDYQTMLTQHINSKAEMTIGCIQTSLDEARQFGVMTIDKNYRVQAFAEKPAQPSAVPDDPEQALVSMGIYIFNKDFLMSQLGADNRNNRSSHDFGKDIIPKVVREHRIFAFPFEEADGNQAYWQDVGTLDAYYQANIDLLSVTPRLNMYDAKWPIWTYQEQLPPAKFVFNDEDRRGMAVDSMISAGCIISGGQVDHSLLFSNVRVNSYSEIKNSVILPNVNIGRHCIIRNAIIDSNCEIPAGTQIGVDLASDMAHYYISPNGIVLVSKEMLRQEAVHHVA
jgi:glucose-1-phosphate adenylyltransferase